MNPSTHALDGAAGSRSPSHKLSCAVRAAAAERSRLRATAQQRSRRREPTLESAATFVAIDALLDELATKSPWLAQAIELRLFAHISTKELANLLQIRASHAAAIWRMGRHQIRDRLAAQARPPP